MNLLTGSARHELTAYFYLTKIPYLLLLRLERLSSLLQTLESTDHYF